MSPIMEQFPLNLAIIIPILVILALLFYYFCIRDPFNPKVIRGKRVVITGASSGIGEQLAYKYAKLSCRLLITARREHLLNTISQKCKDLGAFQVEVVPADMYIASDRIRLVDSIRQLLSGVDHLVLNHAVIRWYWWKGTSEQMTLLEDTLHLNFVSFVDLASRSLPMLMESKGSLGIVSSMDRKIGIVGLSHHSAAKAAQHGFFSSFRQELDAKNFGVAVTICTLGFVKSEKALEVLREVHPGYDFFFGCTPKQAARAVLRGVSTRVREVEYDKLTKYLIVLRSFQPTWIFDNLANKIFIRLMNNHLG